MITEEKSRWARKRSWAEINLDRLEENISLIKAHLSPGTMLMAVIKADAYGHGDAVTAPVMQEAGADWFGVSDLQEGICARKNGITKPILIFSPIEIEYISTAVKNNLTLTISSYEYGVEVNNKAKELGITVKGHVKLDTGMNRLGLLVDGEHIEKNLPDMIKLYSLSNLDITGTYTHFATSDCTEPELVAYKEKQFARFTRALDKLEKAGVDPGIRHCANSGAILCDKNYHLDMVRAGIIMYGNIPGPRCVGVLDLKPVMHIKTKITNIKTTAPGEYVSYGGTYKTDRATEIATVSIGYADGYHRLLSNHGKMSVNGSVIPVIGTVCMDQLMLDVTGVNAKVGDVVTVVGDNTPIDWTSLGAMARTINYELTCAVGRRMSRIYIRNNMDVAEINYLAKDNFE